MTVFGDLRIAATPRGGAVGPAVGAPVACYWPWYRHLPSLGPWLLLALAVALPRTNRQRHALLIFVPMLVLRLLWARVTQLTGMPSATDAQFSFLAEFLALGLALLWLNAERLGGCHVFGRLAGSLGILLLADLAAVTSYWGAFPRQTGMLLVVTATVGVILLVSLTLTRRLAHRRYRPLRFMLWLAAWSSVCSVAWTAALVGVLMLATPYPIHGWRTILTQIVMPGLAISLCLYAANLPYLLLMFTSPFFRRRFRVWLGAESPSPQGETVRGTSGLS